MSARIGTIDIETFPILAFTWGIWQQNINLDFVVRDWSICSVSWKWLGEDEVSYFDVSEQDDMCDDTFLLEAIWSFLDEADIVVVQNGLIFDIKKINARFLQAGMKPPSPYKVVDTKVEAKKIAAFTSVRLDWMAQILTDEKKDRHAEFPGVSLWVECMKRNPRAWEVMRTYNPQDIITTELVYLRMRPYIIGHPNVANYNTDADIQCPKCGSKDMQRRGKAKTQSNEYQRYQCFSCGGWSRSRYTETPITKRRSLLSN
jgi:predicted RNA-binding Zn-ribbon protein involved in translation (DUF1610 family)